MAESKKASPVEKGDGRGIFGIQQKPNVSSDQGKRRNKG
jgi:hypothetical protein